MILNIVKFLWILSGILPTEYSNFVYINDDRSLNDAVQDCINRGLELLTLSTYRQYLDALNYFNTHSEDDSWLALERNTTTGNYQWLNGRVLTELNWRPGEPSDYTEADCGVMNVHVQYRGWYSVPCTYNTHYLCVGSDNSYSVSSVSVDFYTAALTCQSEGRRLPVAITNLDTDWLNDVITSNSLSNDIWLGLIKSGTDYGDYYRWMNGEHLTPPYTWASSSRHSTVHYHHDGNDEGFHSSDTNKREYVCQTKSTDTEVIRSPDKFTFVSNNALIMGSVRKTTNINPARKLQCALECLKDDGCIQFTIQGYLCTTFGESLVFTNYNGGHVLWQRKILF